MYKEQAFKVLKIEPTSNKKEIKKAYAALVKKYHPEESPREWEVIHAAYETAISYAEGRRMEVPISAQEQSQDIPFLTQERTWNPVIETSKACEEDALFGDLDEMAAEQKLQMQSQEREQLRETLQRLDEMADIKKVKKWESFFFEQDIRVLWSSEFLYRWADVILKVQPNKAMRRLFEQQLEDIVQYSSQNNIKHKRIGLLSPVESIRLRLKEDPDKAREKIMRVYKKISLVAFILIWVLVRCGAFREDESEVVERDLPYNSENAYILQTSLDSHYITYGRYSETVQKMLENAAEIQEGMRLIKWDSAVKKNEMSYQYKVITEIEDIGLSNGLSIQDKEWYAISLWTTDESHAVALCLIPEQFGLGEDFKIYYSYDEEYKEIKTDTSYLEEKKDIILYRFGEYYVFSLNVFDNEDDGVKIVFVNGSNNIEQKTQL